MGPRDALCISWRRSGRVRRRGRETDPAASERSEKGTKQSQDTKVTIKEMEENERRSREAKNEEKVNDGSFSIPIIAIVATCLLKCKQSTHFTSIAQYGQYLHNFHLTPPWFGLKLLQMQHVLFLFGNTRRFGLMPRSIGGYVESNYLHPMGKKYASF